MSSYLSNLPRIENIAAMAPADLRELPVFHLAALYDEAAHLLKLHKVSIGILDATVSAKYNERIEAAYATKGEPLGKTSVDDSGYRISIDRPKRIEWCTDLLSVIETRLKDDNCDPLDYIKIKRTVTESKFNGMASDWRAMFAPARTVKTGKQTIKIGIIKE